MAASLNVAFVGNTNIIELEGLKSAIEDEFINDADVEVTIKTLAGTAVDADPDNSIWPIAMEYVEASDGHYRAVIPHDVPLQPDTQYVAHIDANAGAERVGHWEFAFMPKTRRNV